MSYAAQIFLSHSSADRALTEALAALFRTSGFDSLFIDFDPIGGVAPGRNWETELYTALRRCDAVVGVDSPESRNSQWCFAEIALARSLGKTVIVVQVGEQRPESGDSGTAGLTADLQRIVLPAVTESYAEPLFRELVAMGMGRLRSLRLLTGRPPYAGLLPLQEEDAGVFFGRQEETRTLVDLIEKLTKYREKRMVLLIGPSGSGKSSLLRAGIIPQFRQRPGWKVVAPDPLNYETAMREMDAVPGDVMVLMGLDQIDEALTESDGAIFVLLRYAVERRQKRCLVIGTLRSESLATFNERLGGIAEFIERFVVGPLTRSNYREIIELPAQAAGGSVDPNLVDALLADIASSRGITPKRSLGLDPFPRMLSRYLR